MATDHLIKLGHKNIIGIFKSDDNQGLNRYKGYVKALREHNIKIKEDNIIFYTTEEMKTKPREKYMKYTRSGSINRRLLSATTIKLPCGS